MPPAARPAPGELAIREVGRKDDDALWAMLEPVFRAGEAFCVAQDVSRQDGLAFWHRGSCEDGDPNLRRVFLAELAIATGGFSPAASFVYVFAPLISAQIAPRCVLPAPLGPNRLRAR